MKDSAVAGGVVLAAQELKNKVEAQERKYRQTIPFVATLDVLGTPGAQQVNKLRMSTEGDFLCTHITCKINGIDPGTGNYIADPTTFGATGLTLRIFESGWGRELLRDYTALETLATPGYGIIMYQPFPFEQIFLASSDITFDIRNASAVKQQLKFDFHGWQYRGSYKDLRGI